MAYGVTIKDIARETSLFKARVVVAYVFVAVVTLGLVARLTQLQVVNYEHYKTLSRSNRVKLVPIAPTRGLIRDRNGVVMAQNTASFSLEVVPEAIESMDETLASLREILDISEEEERRFRRALGRKRRFESVPLRFRLTDEEVARFAVNRYRFAGVDVRARLTRDYPLGNLAAHVIGYVGRITEAELQRTDATNYRGGAQIGKTGVESAYESDLHGRVGYQQVETNAQGRVLRVLERTDPAPGSDLYLTIDVALQAVADSALGEEAGAVVALDPWTGAVLALVSKPGFDPNLFADGIDFESFRKLNASPDRPLFNRALGGQYPPASTVKPFLGLAALESEVDLARGKTWCPGWFSLKGSKRRYRGWKRGGHGSVGLRKAIVESCDVYFYELALQLGIDRIYEGMTRFGFGAKTGIDLQHEAAGLMPSRRWKRATYDEAWYLGETVITGIGQGFMLATPLQLATATAILATRGRRVTPQVVERIVDPMTGKETFPPPRPGAAVVAYRPENWEKIVDAMVGVVNDPAGTARRIGVGAAVRIAGKTGTAQIFTLAQDAKYKTKKVEKKLRDHAIFISFAPAAAPRIAVAVVVENGGSGSKVAAPIARKVIDQYLRGAGAPERGEALRLTSIESRRTGASGLR